MKDTPAEIMLKHAFDGVVAKSGVDKKLVQDIVVGNVLQPGAGENQARMAMFLSGFPETTTVVALNRFCSSGLEAVAIIAAKIKSGKPGRPRAVRERECGKGGFRASSGVLEPLNSQPNSPVVVLNAYHTLCLSYSQLY